MEAGLGLSQQPWLGGGGQHVCKNVTLLAGCVQEGCPAQEEGWGSTGHWDGAESSETMGSHLSHHPAVTSGTGTAPRLQSLLSQLPGWLQGRGCLYPSQRPALIPPNCNTGEFQTHKGKGCSALHFLTPHFKHLSTSKLLNVFGIHPLAPPAQGPSPHDLVDPSSLLPAHSTPPASLKPQPFYLNVNLPSLPCLKK